MSTGIPGLDHLLGGGLVRGNSLLIEGPPGSGKSTFGVRILYEGIVRYKEPALLITFEEFPKQVYEEALTYGVDLRLMEDAGKLRVIWTPPTRVLEGFTGKSDLIDKIIKELGVRRLVIDSVTHFKRVATSEAELREILLKILNNLKLKGINTILLKELESLDSANIAFEEYLVDASMRVYNSSVNSSGENLRTIEVRKTRGQAHISGRHPFRLGDTGLIVFPHLSPDDLPNAISRRCAKETQRVPTGIEGLDVMLSGGFLPGSFNIVAGYPGTGKSVIGYHFLDQGVKEGKSVILLTFKTSAEQTLSQASSLGMDWRSAFQSQRLRILHYHLTSLCVEQVVSDLLDNLQRQPADHMVLESASDLWNASRDKSIVRDDLLLFRALFEKAAITAVVIQQAKPIGGDVHDTPTDYSDLAECVIQLSMAESEGELRRFVGINKHQGSNHAKELREFQIDSLGFHVDRKAVGLSGILTGQTQGSLRQLSEEILPPLDELSQLLKSLTEGTEPPEKVTDRLKEARSNLGFVDVLLREHFGVTEFQKIAAGEVQNPEHAT